MLTDLEAEHGQSLLLFPGLSSACETGRDAAAVNMKNAGQGQLVLQVTTRHTVSALFFLERWLRLIQLAFC